MQSVPTGSGRNNVGIFFKELADISDIRNLAAFSTGWDGFYQVSTTASAYSSLELQADDKIAFFYEETLTKWGTKANPVSTSFPTGAGTHNFDGFENIYLALDMEIITGGKYSVCHEVNRGEYLKTFFNALIDESELTSADKTTARALVAKLTAEPSTEQIDAIYTLLASKEPADKWDGKILTFTNIQQNGTERTLYIDGSTLSLSALTADELGKKAQFTCKKEESGKYSFFNELTGLYMIWRAGQNYGYNNNAGTLGTYNATYCDWNIVDANSTKAGTYYIFSKRSNGTTDGSLVVMATGVFDSYSATVAWAGNYSNLFYINVIEDEIGIQNTNATPNKLNGKYLEGKQLYIIKDDTKYNVAGLKIR